MAWEGYRREVGERGIRAFLAVAIAEAVVEVTLAAAACWATSTTRARTLGVGLEAGASRGYLSSWVMVKR